jgi:[acyl-carrier-protein] S-malonyltransferase
VTLAFVCAGQGAEQALMGVDVARRWPSARRWIDEASARVGEDLWALLRGGRALDRTALLQPAMVAVQLGALDVVRERAIAPDLVAGHSLGELVAWCASGAVTGEDVLDVAVVRGSAMQRAAERAPGGMLALVGATREEVQQVVEAASGALALAAHNATDEWVVSGPNELLSTLAARHESRRLAASGPWHSAAMAVARAPVATAAGEVPVHPMTAPLVLGATGRVTREADAFPGSSVEALDRPVLFAAVCAALASAGVSDVVTLGPGRVVRGLLRRNLGRDVRVHGTATVAELERTLDELGS